ncbi:uncharacterized protein LOC118192143 [Stegodyphus dumicola]|uniref:uncharacterized protein LOC118192143 n=1 Tax=Stegodyphus dumicola TaxID=202533 RepID=UPI0015AE84B7|nr:uncharacterized protein LOC118192143 [Stegodyphus dumicola]
MRGLEFDGEVEAIKVTVTHLNARPSLSEQFFIFSDFQAAILAIANSCQAPASTSVTKCRSLLCELHEKHKMIILQLILYHCGIPVNKRADELAKRACSIIQVSDGQDGYKHVSSKINMSFKTRQLPQLKERTRDKL